MRPVVAIDERPVQLLRDLRSAVPAKPGRIARKDYEYKRIDVVSAFLFTNALEAWRRVWVRERRTAIDWTEEVKYLLDEVYPEAQRVTLVCDNLNTHKIASLYKAFPADEALGLASRLELVHTPKHGSWLNIAEIELSIFSRKPRLNRRLPDLTARNSKGEDYLMKEILCSTLALLIFVMFIFLPNSFAQGGSPQQVVRLIYFIPNDRESDPDIDARLDSSMKDVQQFYADQMESHGFGPKTFRLEKDGAGNVVVHHVKGKSNSLYYSGNQNFLTLGERVRPEINERFDTSKNIYVTIVNIGWTGGGIAYMNGFGGTTIKSDGGDNRFVAAHELGHIFGLRHDFRTNHDMMSYTGWKPSLQLSYCGAEWLDVHPYFNAERGQSNLPDAPTTIQMLPATASLPNAIRLRFKVTDADGLHQAQLLTPFSDFETTLTDCKRLNRQKTTTIEFVTTELMNSYPDSYASLKVIDVNGNFTSGSFDIDIARLLPSNKVVSIPDAKLAAAIRATLKLPPRTDITQADMRRLKELSANEHEIKTLTGIEHAKGLRRLYLSGNQISDITPLAGLTNLVECWLSGNQISDIAPLAGLINLSVLFIDSNQISDITPLAGLTNLDVLYLDGNREISDITPLAKLTNLTQLFLRNLEIEDVTPLERLVNLKLLGLEGTPVKDRNPLLALLQRNPDVEIYLKHGGGPLSVTLPNFREDRAESEVDVPEPISLPEPVEPVPPPRAAEVVSMPDRNLAAAVRKTLDLGPNAAISKQRIRDLTRLDARNSQIKDLTGLEQATRLRSLELRDNQITNIRPLVNLRNLQELILDSNRVSDIRPLANMKQLTWLLIGSNPISDFAPLTNLTELGGLSLYGNNINDVTPFASLTKLTNLWLGRNKIRDITPLTDLVNLKVLSLHDNQIRDVSPLAELVNLETLHLKNNPIQDTSALTSLTKLRDVDIEISQPSVVVQVEASERPPMYWINVRRSILHRLVGTEVENLVPNVRNATDLAIDVTGGKLYWTERTSNRTGRIRRANLDGTNVQLVKNLTSVPRGIALDTAGGKIYLTNSWGKIQRLNVDGSNFQPNFITDLDAPGGLALDVSGGKVYWIERSGRIRRANLNGSNIENVVTVLGSSAMGIAVFDNTVYWTEKIDGNQGEIRSIGLGRNARVMIRHTFTKGFPVGIAVDPMENKLYWTTSDGKIGRSTLDGGDFQPNFATGLSAPGSFVLNVETPVDVEIPEMLTTDAVLSISPSPIVSPAIGERLMLNLNIAAGEAVAGYQFTLQFDATALRYVESSNGDYLPTGAFFVPPILKGNRVELASTALAGVSNGDGTLATLIFEVLTVKASTLTLSRTLLSDSEGNTFLPRVEGSEVTLPPKLQTDVNSDGVVNIQDLVLVASSFGQTGQNPADINADGVVNIADLVLVAGALGTSAAAPLLYPDTLEMLATADVHQWLSQAYQLNSSHVDYQRGLLRLEQLLFTLMPKETALLPNYPNPFNPETWIPYQLSKSGDVHITICDARGVVVRHLALGHQPAGVYQNKSRAAYWDGRNNLGEPVASGIYFYTLTAGDFTATRKMLIRK